MQIISYLDNNYLDQKIIQLIFLYFLFSFDFIIRVSAITLNCS